MTDVARPSAGSTRHEMMDAARGVAVLGILWLNIFLFALPFEAMVIPMIWGEHNVLNQAVWDFTTTSVSGVMRGMFSILFGASAMLLLGRAERAADQVAAIDRYFRRLIWLIVFGAVHAYLLLWPHDILYAYGLLGMLIFPFRHVATRRLVIVAVVMIIGSSVFTSQNVEEIGEARGVAEETLSDEERERLRHDDPLVDELDDYGGLRAVEPLLHLTGSAGTQAEAADEVTEEELDYEAFVARLNEEIDERLEGYVANLLSLAPESFQQQTTEMIGNHLLDIGAFLLIGMVLFRTGFFFGDWAPRTYLRIAVGGYALGMAIGVVNAMDLAEDGVASAVGGFAAEYGFDVRRLALALANFSLVALLVGSGRFAVLRRSLAACGRMALTLYVSQTIVCNTLFLGYGLSQFGQLEHYQLALTALGLTVLQMLVAPLFLQRFAHGPLEHVLRKLVEWGRPNGPTQSGSAPRRRTPVGQAT